MTVPAGYRPLPLCAVRYCENRYVGPDGREWCCAASAEVDGRRVPSPSVTTVAVPLPALAAIANAARECAEDLAAEIDAKHPLRHEQPVQKRRHERDMQVVHRVIDALGALPKWTTP